MTDAAVTPRRRSARSAFNASGEHVVRITPRQQAQLFEELRLHAELRYTLHDGALVGSSDTLSAVARRIEDSLTLATALGQSSREAALQGVLSRLAKASIVPAVIVPDVSDADGSGVESTLPESQFSNYVAPKALHHSKANRVWYEVETLRKGRKGRVGAKSNGRAINERGMVRGDRIFSHDEIVRGGTVITPNDETVIWLRAGSNPGDKLSSSAKTREGRKAQAAARVKLPRQKRIAATAEVVLAKHGKLRASWISVEMSRDDLRVGKYEFRSEKMRQAQKRYTAYAKAWMLKHPVEAVTVATFTPDAQEAAASISHVERLFTPHVHAWGVSPQRQRRSCECGAVERKQSGRWVAVAPKVVAPKRTRRSAAQREAAIQKQMDVGKVTREKAIEIVKRLDTFR